MSEQPSSAILDLASCRLELIGRCEALGLTTQAHALRVRQSDYPGLLRSCVMELHAVTSGIAEVATHASLPDLAESARFAAQLAMSTARVCDVVIAERFAANERGPAVGLKPSARPFGGFR